MCILWITPHANHTLQEAQSKGTTPTCSLSYYIDQPLAARQLQQTRTQCILCVLHATWHAVGAKPSSATTTCRPDSLLLMLTLDDVVHDNHQRCMAVTLALLCLSSCTALSQHSMLKVDWPRLAHSSLDNCVTGAAAAGTISVCTAYPLDPSFHSCQVVDRITTLSPKDCCILD